jgi:serine/threonine protein kinase
MVGIEDIALDRVVGSDELGEVKAGRSSRDGETYAVKRFAEWALAAPGGAGAFVESVRALAARSTSRTPAVIDVSLSPGAGTLVTRWIDGPTLESVLASRGTLPVAEATEVACGILDALEELHHAAGAHGGLTPRKVLLTRGTDAGGVIITDPYQHLLYSVDDPARSLSAEPERFIGTPQYFSPEQAQGKRPTAASDIYAVGLLLYQMLTGKTPFDSGSASRTLKRHVFEKPLPLRLASAGVKPTKELEAAVAKALQKEPSARFSSAAEMREALGGPRPEAEVPSRNATMAFSPVVALGLTSTGTAAAPTGPEPAAAGPKAVAGESTLRDSAELRVVEPRVELDASLDDSAPAQSGPGPEPAESAPVPAPPGEVDAASTDGASGLADASIEPPPSVEVDPSLFEPEPAPQAAADPVPQQPTAPEPRILASAAPSGASGSRKDKRDKKKDRGQKGQGGQPDPAMSATPRADAALPAPPVESTEPSPSKASASRTPAASAPGRSSSVTNAAAPDPRRSSKTRALFSMSDDDHHGWFNLGDDQERLAEYVDRQEDEAEPHAQRLTGRALAVVVVVVLLALAGIALALKNAMKSPLHEPQTEQR